MNKRIIWFLFHFNTHSNIMTIVCVQEIEIKVKEAYDAESNVVHVMEFSFFRSFSFLISSEAYWGLCQASKMERFAKIVNGRLWNTSEIGSQYSKRKYTYDRLYKKNLHQKFFPGIYHYNYNVRIVFLTFLID